MSERTPWNDERVEALIGKLLQAGVMISAGVVLLSGIWYLVRFGGAHADYHSFRLEPAPLRSIGGILRGLASWDSRAWIQFGVLLLILTPVARVAFAAAAFLFERDRTYVVVSLIVLAVLLYSLSGI